MPVDCTDYEYLLAHCNKIALLIWENIHDIQNPKLQGRNPGNSFLMAARGAAEIQSVKVVIVSDPSGTFPCILNSNI